MLSLREHRIGMVSWLAVIALAVPGAAEATAPPAGPPAAGPGSQAELQWSGKSVVAHTFTDATHNYTTFEPTGWTGAGLQPTSEPVVIFMHGYLGIDPSTYATWIDHIVRRGNIVIYPAYQANALTPPSTYTANAMWSVADALPWLSANATVKPNTSGGVILMAHSYGGPVAANYANRAAAAGLPPAAGILFGEPWWQNIDAELSQIPAATKILCLVGDHDTLAGRRGCDVLWDRTGQVPTSHRNYVLLRSDAHGTPPLDASHRIPSDLDPAGFNALDWYGYWKLGDAVRDCSLYGSNCEYAFGNTWEQTFMGYWDDGTLVNQLWVYERKPADPFPDPGASAAAPGSAAKARASVRFGKLRRSGRMLTLRVKCEAGERCAGLVRLELLKPIAGRRKLGERVLELSEGEACNLKFRLGRAVRRALHGGPIGVEATAKLAPTGGETTRLSEVLKLRP